MNKVYMTGFGLVSSLGKNTEETFQALKLNKSATVFSKEWSEIAPLRSKVYAPVSDWDNSFIPRHSRRFMSKMSEMICKAFEESQSSTKINFKELGDLKVLIIVGSTAGSQTFAEEFFVNLRKNEAAYLYCNSFIKTMGHTVLTNLSNYINYDGPSISIASACATSSQSVVMGWEYINSGLYDLVICGGADEIDVYTAMVFDNVNAASTQFNDTPDKTPRPFDSNRDGIVVSEGASIIILESEMAMSIRGSKPIIEILGGFYSRSGGMPTQNSTESIIQTMNGAIRNAKIKPNDISYINAHATGTTVGDENEALAMKTFFTHNPLVSSLKGHLGHSLAASGGIEIILTTKMLNEGVLIPTRNLETLDLAFTGVNYLTHLTNTNQKIAMSNNFGFGGVNTSIILKKYSPEML